MDEAARLFSSGQAVFVDARSAQDYAQGHIEGAVSIPVFAFVQMFPRTRAQLEGKTIITYCDGEGCTLSQDLADQLKASGLANVFVLKNGWSLWKDAGLPLAASQEPALQDDASQGNLTQETPTQEPAPQETAPQGNLTQDALPQQAAPTEALPQDPLPQDTAPLDQTPAAPSSQEPKPAGDPS
jgi:rhodanese-related sulfurtransferase